MKSLRAAQLETETGWTLVFNGTNGDDTLEIDLSGGNPLPFGGIPFNGGSGDDNLTIIDGGAAVAYEFSNVAEAGTITIDGSTITYTNVEPNTVTIRGAATVTLDLTDGDTFTFTEVNSTRTRAQGSSNAAAVSLQDLTAGSFNYKDLGGGVDTLNLADSTAGKTLRVNVVTRIDTGAASDTVRIATTGTAIFNDNVFIALGAGNDLLFIGQNATSPAFSGASKYQFDGGAGFDTFDGSPLSIAEYDGVPLKKKLKSKIVNFEDLLTN